MTNSPTMRSRVRSHAIGRRNMERRDKAEFTVLIDEISVMYGQRHSPVLAARYWHVLEAIPMDAIRQACLDLIGDPAREEGMPSAVEIQRAAQALASATTGGRYLRCLHVDYGKPPRTDDQGERHWRCPARFPLTDD